MVVGIMKLCINGFTLCVKNANFNIPMVVVVVDEGHSTKSPIRVSLYTGVGIAVVVVVAVVVVITSFPHSILQIPSLQINSASPGQLVWKLEHK
jgi:hypothetical protein